MTRMTHTWDGLPIADDHPRGSSIVVRRADGRLLVLHRALHGADFAGDWAWTPPSGARFPGEPILVGALRELAEEAGLTGLDPQPVDLGAGWALWVADVPLDTVVTLDHEHDRYAWLTLAEAVDLCAPETIADNLRRAAASPPAPTPDGLLTHRISWERVELVLAEGHKCAPGTVWSYLRDTVFAVARPSYVIGSATDRDLLLRLGFADVDGVPTMDVGRVFGHR